MHVPERCYRYTGKLTEVIPGPGYKEAAHFLSKCGMQKIPVTFFQNLENLHKKEGGDFQMTGRNRIERPSNRMKKLIAELPNPHRPQGKRRTWRIDVKHRVQPYKADCCVKLGNIWKNAKVKFELEMICTSNTDQDRIKRCQEILAGIRIVERPLMTSLRDELMANRKHYADRWDIVHGDALPLRTSPGVGAAFIPGAHNLVFSQKQGNRFGYPGEIISGAMWKAISVDNPFKIGVRNYASANALPLGSCLPEEIAVPTLLDHEGISANEQLSFGSTRPDRIKKEQAAIHEVRKA
ncbi:hypothetical protein Tco_0742388 [Tanacetum coccineum]